MEATPPQEPTRKKETPPSPPPAPVVRTSRRAPRLEPVAVEEPVVPPEGDDIDLEQEATRIYGALALGVMAVLLVCMIAFLIAYRHAPEGL